MKNKALKIATIILGIIAISGIVVVSTNEDIQTSIKQRREQSAFERVLSSNDADAMQKYLNNYPQAPKSHRERVRTKMDGVREKQRAAAEERDYKSALSRDTETAWNEFLSSHPNGKYASDARARLRYYNNSLKNGAQPYSYEYGYNRSCNDWGCSAIIVNAPNNSDMVAFIKNGNGKVVRHAYICAGRSYTFEVPNGTYQPFFYYGKGWNPDKAMSKGMRGGFLKNEQHSYVKSAYLNNQEWTLTLELTTNGNLSTHSCSESEMF